VAKKKHRHKKIMHAKRKSRQRRARKGVFFRKVAKPKHHGKKGGIFHFLKPKHYVKVKRVVKPVVAEKKSSYLIQPRHIETMKKLLHDLYFTKREEEIIQRERENATEITQIGKELALSEKEMENKIKELQNETKKIKTLEESLAMMNKIFTEIAEIRKENEDLRKEIQFLLNKMNTIILEKERKEEFSEMPEEISTEESLSTYAKHEGGDKIKTSLDSLLDLIMKSGSIKIPDAAKKLNMKEKQIEEWAHVLEDHGLIEIHYPTFGKPFLKKKV